jgi:hypothetical protein
MENRAMTFQLFPVISLICRISKYGCGKVDGDWSKIRENLHQSVKFHDFSESLQ